MGGVEGGQWMENYKRQEGNSSLNWPNSILANIGQCKDGHRSPRSTDVVEQKAQRNLTKVWSRKERYQFWNQTQVHLPAAVKAKLGRQWWGGKWFIRLPASREDGGTPALKNSSFLRWSNQRFVWGAGGDSGRGHFPGGLQTFSFSWEREARPWGVGWSGVVQLLLPVSLFQCYLSVCLNQTPVVSLPALASLLSLDTCALSPARAFLTTAARAWPEVRAQGWLHTSICYRIHNFDD